MKTRTVPDDYPSLSDALVDHGPDGVHLYLAADYEEPSPPLALTVKGPITIEGQGDSRAIVRHAITLERFEEPAVEIRLCKLSLSALTVAGFLRVTMDDCEVDGHRCPLSASIDVREQADLRMLRCNVRNCLLGLRVHFPATADVQAVFEGNRIGMALLNNPRVNALESTFTDSQWANVTMQCRWTDGPMVLQPLLPAMDLDVAVDGPWGSITYKTWPLPTEQRVVTRKKRKPIIVDVSPQVIHCDHADTERTEHVRLPTTGSSWAREVLGLHRCDLDRATVGHAYRKRARLVHPDKTNDGSVAFLRLQAAYDVLRQEVKKSRRQGD